MGFNFMGDFMRKKEKLVYGFGVNDAPYEVQKFENVGGSSKRIWMCQFYKVWSDMLKRCYSIKYQDGRPTYKNCHVAEEWLTFSAFKEWMESQSWKGKELDKDILFAGNKIYSPKTCVFVTQLTNSFTVAHDGARGDLPIGVSWHKHSGKFQAICRNPFTGKREFLGKFSCQKIAHAAWKKRKHELACRIAELQDDIRVAASLRARYADNF